MRRILSLIALNLLIMLQATSQNLNVTQFKLLENSTVASQNRYERFDRNGEKCAIIRVVRPRPGFQFDTGLMDLAHQEDPKDHPGETWLWVSPMLRTLAISHETFGKCRYEIPIEVEGGRTYEMLLDIGTGRFVNITTTPSGATMVIDGDYIGQSPIYNHYLDMGVHNIEATRDKYEGRLQKVITMNDKIGDVINVVLEDQSRFYGNVVVDVDGNADIFFNGVKVETGTWRTQLKEGTYSVETRHADCDPQTTTFNVVAGQENKVKAIAPVPHTGYLSIYTRPRNASAFLDGDKPIDLTTQQTLTVGTHQLLVQRKGYVEQTHEYTIRRNETTKDTVQLERIKYVKPLAFYFGGGYTISSMSGVTGILGAVIKNNDIQLSYTFGMAESDPVHWYGDNGTWLSTTKYKQNTLALHYGYQFNLMRTLAITPQVGFSLASLKGNLTEGSTNYADGASAQLASIGVKLLLVPIHHLYVFASPQYAFTVGKSDNFKLLSDHADIKVDGFQATIGLLLNF